MNKFTVILLCSLLYAANTVAEALQTRYVTDQFEIYLRSGKSAKHRILKTLHTGDEVTLLQQDRKSGYSQIRTADGRTGFVLTRQLLEEPVARSRLPALEARIAELESDPDNANLRLAALSQDFQKLTRAHQDLLQEKRDLELKLAELQRISGEAIRIDQERRKLREQVAKMTHTIEDQKQQIRELENSSVQRWFLIGAAVLAIGILLGLILPNLRLRRSKSAWDSL